MSEDKVSRALEDIKRGKMVLVFDSDNRERETDMVVPSQFVTHHNIKEMRKNAGGLICTTVNHDLCEKLDIPFLADVLTCAHDQHPVLTRLAPNDLPYDTKSAFSLTINHRKTFTGITDRDRAMTISEFAKLAENGDDLASQEAQEEFGRQFRSPGHVYLLRASKDLLTKRFGHTELSTALMVMAGVIPSATLCEMMGDDGNALSKEKAKRYAQRFDLCFLEGKEIVEAWNGGR